MTEFQIEEYLLKLENELLFESTNHKVELSRTWAKSFPNESAVYIFVKTEKFAILVKQEV